jgi:hypothetical protein
MKWLRNVRSDRPDSAFPLRLLMESFDALRVPGFLAVTETGLVRRSWMRDRRNERLAAQSLTGSIKSWEL